MKTYIVEQEVVYTDFYEVEAESEDEAKQLVANGDGSITDSEYSHILGDNLVVYEKKNIFARTD